jgi:glutathione S-transferase
MDKLTLVIGNKNYSSWSLRPWLLLTQFEIPFEEIRIPLYQTESKAQINKYSPSGLVPVLINGNFTVWDSLAICEYVQELFPTLNMWPRDREARAIARAVSAEMHSGFSAVRTHMPMNCKKSFPGKGLNPDSESQIKRITQLWRECRDKYGNDGPMLFGGFTIADAMFAPVAVRFNTYQVELDETSQAYVSAILALPAMKKWVAAGCLESEVMPQFEPYEKKSG